MFAVSFTLTTVPIYHHAPEKIDGGVSTFGWCVLCLARGPTEELFQEQHTLVMQGDHARGARNWLTSHLSLVQTDSRIHKYESSTPAAQSTTISKMPTSFLDLPLELRDDIYKLIIPIERATDGEPFTLNTDTTYCQSRLLPSLSDENLSILLPTALAEALRMWASVLRKLPNITTLSCLTCLHVMRGKSNDWSSIVWSDKAVLEAIRGLAHIRVMLIEGAQRANGAGCSVFESSLELTVDKPFLETLVVSGHPITGVKWYPEDYFDRLRALKNLAICNGSRMQSGNSKVSSEVFSHVASLRSFTWHGHYLTTSYRKSFTTRHGSTLQFLRMYVHPKYYDDKAAQRSEESACVDSLANMFGALPVLKLPSLTYCYISLD